MRRWRLIAVLPLGAGVLGAVAVALWLRAAPGQAVEARLPIEQEPMGRMKPRVIVQNPGTTTPGSGRPSALQGSWPQFRGLDRTNVVREGPRLARTWPPEGPRRLWELKLSEGHSGPAVHNGRLYVMDYVMSDSPDGDVLLCRRDDAVLCLSPDDGREIWRYTYTAVAKNNHGISRTVPAVNDDYVVTLGPRCHVVCLDAASGRLVWKKDLVKEHGTTVPGWHAGQCPLIEEGRVILAPGGDPLMMAVELSSGRTLWETPNPGGWGMTHSSISAIDHPDGRQYAYCTTNGVVGVSAEDGRLLWSREDWVVSPANSPAPVVVGHDQLLLTADYKAGSMMIRLTSPTETEILWRLGSRVFGSRQHTPVLYQDHIYAVILNGELVCVDLYGKRLWHSDRALRFGNYGRGPYIIADDLLFALHEKEGTLHMVEISPGGYRELAWAKVVPGGDAWAPMAIVDARIILRDPEHLVCLDLPREARQ